MLSASNNLRLHEDYKMRRCMRMKGKLVPGERTIQTLFENCGFILTEFTFHWIYLFSPSLLSFSNVRKMLSNYTKFILWKISLRILIRFWFENKIMLTVNYNKRVICKCVWNDMVFHTCRLFYGLILRIRVAYSSSMLTVINCSWLDNIENFRL